MLKQLTGNGDHCVSEPAKMPANCGLFVRDRETAFRIGTAWWWMQSPTNWSPRLNSLIYGNLQGIFYSLQGIGPETQQKRLPDPAVTMKFPTQRNREFLRA